MSVRSDITAALKDRFSDLAGFTTVERWRDTQNEPFDVAECPAVNIKPGRCPITHMLSNDEHSLEILLDVVTVAGCSDVEIETLLEVLVNAIELDPYWNNLADGTTIESHDIDTAAEMADTVTSGQLKITVNYTTDKGKI